MKNYLGINCSLSQPSLEAPEHHGHSFHLLLRQLLKFGVFNLLPRHVQQCELFVCLFIRYCAHHIGWGRNQIVLKDQQLFNRNTIEIYLLATLCPVDEQLRSGTPSVVAGYGCSLYCPSNGQTPHSLHLKWVELEMGTFRYKVAQFIRLFVVMAQSLCLQNFLLLNNIVFNI